MGSVLHHLAALSGAFDLIGWFPVYFSAASYFIKRLHLLSVSGHDGDEFTLMTRDVVEVLSAAKLTIGDVEKVCVSDEFA